MKKLLWLILIALTIAGGVILIKKKKEELANLPTPQPPELVVQTANPTLKEVNQTKRLLGRYYAYDEALIATKIPGRVKKLHVQEGQSVHKDQPLVDLDKSEIEAQIAAQEALVKNLKAQIKAQEALLHAAKIDESAAYKSLKRDRRLYKAGALAREKYELKEALYAAKKAKLQSAQAALAAKRNELQAAITALASKKELLTYTQITAPFEGSVAKLFFKEGSFAPLGKPIVKLLGQNFVLDLPFDKGVEPKMKVKVKDRLCEVDRILPQSANSLKVARILCDEPLRLPNDTQLPVLVIQKSLKDYALPIQALFEQQNKTYVFIKTANGFEPVAIEVEVASQDYFIPNPRIKEPVAVGSNEKLAKLFSQRRKR
ncbi:MAG: hypothetical protein C6H99_01300 [Epsilonproteobacteria bacterium]|nr:hypothetical protein [Campylobacterota bacterium]NPA63608.1 biotin/lipoyl-binding protein [Campylobacterota bacterium]